MHHIIDMRACLMIMFIYIISVSLIINVRHDWSGEQLELIGRFQWDLGSYDPPACHALDLVSDLCSQ